MRCNAQCCPNPSNGFFVESCKAGKVQERGREEEEEIYAREKKLKTRHEMRIMCGALLSTSQLQVQYCTTGTVLVELGTNQGRSFRKCHSLVVKVKVDAMGGNAQLSVTANYWTEYSFLPPHMH